MGKRYPILLFLLSLFCGQLFAQNVSGTLDHDGLTREYILHVPTEYDEGLPTPLVLALHGLGDNINNFSNVGLSPLADSENFFVVYPQAIESSLGLGTAWNNGAGAFGIVLNAEIDDVGFLTALIDNISSEYNIDQTRVYSTGFSMGGIMTHRLACDLSDRLAAVASVSGPMPDASAANCLADRPMPVMHMHGTADAVVGYADGNFNGFDAGLHGAEESIDFWKAHNGCSEIVLVNMLPDAANDGYTVETHDATECDGDGRALLYKIEGADHTWLQSNNDVNANVEIWNFFSQYTYDGGAVSSKEIKLAKTKVFPNPFHDELALSIPAGHFERAELFNLTGKMITTFSIEMHAENILLNLAHVESGQYFLRLTGSSAETVKLQKF